MLFILAVFAFAVSKFGWDWTGFTVVSSRRLTAKTPSGTTIVKIEEQQLAKTFWDWLQLAGIVAIPVVVGLGAARFTAKSEEANRKQRETEQKIATDNQHEAALQEYINNMSELLLEKRLRESQPEDEVRKIARVQTLTALSRLDGRRKRSVLQFLYETDLIDKANTIIHLKGADLSKADLTFANFKGANLTGAYFKEADLGWTLLEGVNLSKADLSSANLKEARLAEANLSKAYLAFADLRFVTLSNVDLGEAHLTFADLSGALLEGANLSKADLSSANLTLANLSKADLSKADLGTNQNLLDIDKALEKSNFREFLLRETSYSRADQRADYLKAINSPNLRDAILRETNLTRVNLTEANLSGTNVTPKQLQQAISLEDTILPEGLSVTRLSGPNEPGFYLVRRVGEQ